jgi:hypothetical protein
MNDVRDLRLADGTQGVDCFGHEHARAVVKELVKAAIAYFRLTKMRGVEERCFPRRLSIAFQKDADLIDIDLVADGLDQPPIAHVFHGKRSRRMGFWILPLALRGNG